MDEKLWRSLKMMQINPRSYIEKLQKASPMNSVEEKVCEECNQIIFEKEMHIICQIKLGTEFKLKTMCCDCFKKKVENDIERINNWGRKSIEELNNMINPIMAYMNSDIKKQIDCNRMMLKKIEGEGGL
jgi:hypothetical protein